MKLNKIEKILGEEIMEEIRAMGEEELKKVIIQAEQSMKEAKDELEANPKFQQLKEDLKALRCGFLDVKKFQTAKLNLALMQLNPSEEVKEEAEE